MATKKFPFITFDPTGPKQPLVPFDFPVGKNVYCLIDSGASHSLMSESFMRHENAVLEKGSRESKSEGICGNNCIDVIGTTEPIQVSIAGMQKTFELTFTVIPDKFRIGFAIFGQNLFEKVKVAFGWEGGNLFTYIDE